MKTIEERARLAAWQIFEEIGLSQHSVDRVAEIIAEKIHEQKALDIDKACKWLEGYCCEIGRKYDCNFDDIMVDGPKRFRKTMEK